MSNDWLKDMERDVFLHYGEHHIFTEIYRQSDEQGQDQILDIYSALYRGRAHEMIDTARKASIHFENHVTMAKGDPFHSLYMGYLVHKYLKDEYEKEKKGSCSQQEIGAKMAQIIDEKLGPELDEAVQAHGDMMEVIQGDEPGASTDQITSQDLADLKRIAGLCNDARFATIMKLMGSFWRSYQRRLREEVFPSNVVPVDVQFGNSLPNLLASEMLAFAHPTLKRLFKIKFATKKLLEFYKQEKTSSERGPVYIALDISGSMHAQIAIAGHGWAERCELAAALVLVIMRISYKEKRDFEFFLFGSSTRHAFSSKTYPRLLDALEAVAKSCRGNEGTEIHKMFQSLVTFKRKANAPQEPDFVVISDMEDRCPPESINSLRPIIGKTRCHGLIVHDTLDSGWIEVFTTVIATQDPDKMTSFLVDATKKVSK